MVSKLVSIFILLGTVIVLNGCGSEQGGNLQAVPGQPSADLEAGAKAQTIADWEKANPNNGAPGSGEGEREDK